MKIVASKRWVLMNKKTLKQGHGYDTRAQARARKTSNQAIYDTANLAFVR